MEMGMFFPKFTITWGIVNCKGDQGFKIHIAILRAQTRSQERDVIK